MYDRNSVASTTSENKPASRTRSETGENSHSVHLLGYLWSVDFFVFRRGVSYALFVGGKNNLVTVDVINAVVTVTDNATKVKHCYDDAAAHDLQMRSQPKWCRML
jgi:hypothetical protein